MGTAAIATQQQLMKLGSKVREDQGKRGGRKIFVKYQCFQSMTRAKRKAIVSAGEGKLNDKPENSIEQ